MCNDANVPDGLLIGLYIAVALVTALSGEAILVVWLLVRRRVSLGWLFALAVALTVATFCMWVVTDILSLRAGLEAGTAGGKGGCMGFWNQQLYLKLCAFVAFALAVALSARVRYGSRRETARM